MKKLLTLTLSLLMAFSLCLTISAQDDDENSNSGNDNAATTSTTVAKIGDTGYSTLQAAINAVSESSSATINVVANTNENITIPSGKNITLVIESGVTLKNNGDHTIVNSGTLTITGDGTIDNVTHKKGDLVNNYGATATLQGGVSFTRSAEASNDKNTSGGNSWYNISNQGTLTIKDGVKVTSSGAFSSLIRNGDVTTESVLTIENGEFSGGVNTVKNGDYGKLYIKGGTFSNTTQATVLNWHYAEISGGTFTPSSNASYAVLVGKWIEHDKQNSSTVKYTTDGNTVITGGTFSGGLSQYENEKEANNYEHGTFTISGGTFTSDVSGYLASGYTVIDKGDSSFDVVKKGDPVNVNTTTAAITSDARTALNNQTIYGKTSGQEKTVSVDSSTQLVLEVERQDFVYNQEYDEPFKKAFGDDISNVKCIPLDITLKSGDIEIYSLNAANSDETVKMPVTLYLTNDDAKALNGKDIKVVRIHKNENNNYEYEALPATLNGNILTFESGKFSTYLITYRETSSNTNNTSTKSYDAKDKNKDGVVSCEEEMNSANWIWSTTKNACVYKVTNTSAK